MFIFDRAPLLFVKTCITLSIIKIRKETLVPMH